MKITLLSFILFIHGWNLHAQTIYPRLGLTASVNTNRPVNYDVKPRMGFTVGIGYDHTFSKLISWRAELNVIQKSFATEHEEITSLQYNEDIYEIDEKGTDRYRIYYLEVPLLLKIRLLHKDFFVLAGPSLAMGMGGARHYVLDRNSSYLGNLHEEGKGDIKFSSSSPQTDKDVRFDNRWDIGIHAGFGALLFQKLEVTCAYTQGTVNLYKNINSKNKYLQIAFALPFSLKR